MCLNNALQCEVWIRGGRETSEDHKTRSVSPHARGEFVCMLLCLVALGMLGSALQHSSSSTHQLQFHELVAPHLPLDSPSPCRISRITPSPRPLSPPKSARRPKRSPGVDPSAAWSPEPLGSQRTGHQAEGQTMRRVLGAMGVVGGAGVVWGWCRSWLPVMVVTIC